MVVPVINNSVEVSASDYFLSTVPIPVAENGYYVFPVNLVKRVLEDDGLSDANLVHSASTEKLCELFGADAALYIIIKRWEAQYIVISAQVTVELTYVLKEGVTGEEIWKDEQTVVYSPQGQGGGGGAIGAIIAMAIAAAITKANPNYIPLARQANQKAFAYPGPGFPHGPYAKVKEKTPEKK
ncbi:MAG: lipoprotein [Nitrospinaceae bacterium]|nr:MAG: lipoprotein [Nitrospinaceae bacterium]